MRKSLLILFIAFISMGANAQTFDWQVLSSANVGSFTNTSNTYSVAYFKGGIISGPVTVGARVYVATRGATTIDVLNAETGAFVKNISSTGGDSFRNLRIRATESGEIYTVGLKLAGATSSDGETIQGSYFADENSSAVTFNFPYPTGMTSFPRMGDSFEIVGSGINTYFYIGGSGSSFIYVYKRNISGGADLIKSINIGGDLAAQSISVIPNNENLGNSSFFVSHNTTSNLRKLFKYESATDSYNGVTLPTRVYDATAPNNFSQLKYFKIDTVSYLATTGGSTDPSSKNIKIFRVVDSTNYSLNASFELVTTLSGGSYTYVTGNSGFSDLVFSKNIVKAGDFGAATSYDLKLIQLVTRNAISAYTLNFSTNGTLPVSLISFSAAVKNTINTLAWSTASEANNAGFEIESSIDGSNFTKIGFVASKAANGNSSNTLTYSFEDKTAGSGTTYYRLKQIDLNGAVQYSGVKSINNKLQKDAEFSVYPNPVSTVLNIASPLQDLTGYECVLYNNSGVKVKSQSLKSIKAIDVSDLSPSVYTVTISKEGDVVQSFRIIKK